MARKRRLARRENFEVRAQVLCQGGKTYVYAPSAVRSGAQGEPSIGRHPTVDDEFTPRHPGGLIGGEIKTASGDVGGSPKAAERRRRQTHLRHLGIGMARPCHG